MTSQITPLIQLVPPRHGALMPADQMEMICALLQAQQSGGHGVALEIAGEAGHLRFLARATTSAERERIAMVFAGYYPQGRAVTVVVPADDPACLRDGEDALAVELRLRGPNELPLRTLERDETGTQLLRVLGVLRSLPTGVHGLCQLILWPAPVHWGRDMERWLQQERVRRTLEIRQAASVTAEPPTGGVAGLVLAILAGTVGYHYYQHHDLVRLTAVGAAVAGIGAVAAARRLLLAHAVPPDPDLVERKLQTLAFTARLRLLVTGGDETARRHALRALVTAYGAYEEPRGNAFVARCCAPEQVAAITTRGGPRCWRRPWPILSAAEVIALFHLPADAIEVPGLRRTGPRLLLPTSDALKDGVPVGDVTLGTHREAVHIPHAAYRANTLVLGATGTGKSTFLQHYARDAVALDDVQLAVVDPDSALIADLVGWLPDHQKLRAVVLDLGHPIYAVGLNLLDAYTARRPDQIIDSLVQAWAGYYGEAWGPRLEDLIRYGCATLLAANRTRHRERQLTLLDLKPLLQVSAFRDAVLREVGDVQLMAYWRDDYLGMPRTERLTAIKPVLTRVNRFLLNDAAHAVIGQPASTIDIPHLLDSGAPLFIDAAAHTVGEETAALLDAVLLNTIHDAVCERGDHRRHVLIVVDEFQHTPALWDEYLPRIRKFGGAYVLAAQGLASIDRVQRDLHHVVVGNTATQVVFRNPDPNEARYLAGVLDNTVAAEDVQTLGLRQCYLKTSDAQGPLPVVSATLPPPPRSNAGTARLIAAACARRYGRSVADVLAARARWMTELFYAVQAERPVAVDGVADGAGSNSGDSENGAHSASAVNASPAPDEPAIVEAAAGMEPSSQPSLGLPPTRPSPHDRKRSRPSGRGRRHRLMPPPDATQDKDAPFRIGSSMPALADPLPLPLRDQSEPRQLPLLPEVDDTH